LLFGQFKEYEFGFREDRRVSFARLKSILEDCMALAPSTPELRYLHAMSCLCQEETKEALSSIKQGGKTSDISSVIGPTHCHITAACVAEATAIRARPPSCMASHPPDFLFATDESNIGNPWSE
jgi:hypothetical protein